MWIELGGRMRKDADMRAETKGSKSAKRVYRGEYLDRIAFPLGGIGAGMMSLEGTGSIAQVSLRHKPDVNHYPQMFAALFVEGAATARVLEGNVPMWKAFGLQTGEPGNGLNGYCYGLPRFREASFHARFPFGTVELSDPGMPVAVTITGWSPFTPGASDDSSLPVAGLEYRIKNRSGKTMKSVFSYHARNFMRIDASAVVDVMGHGFVLRQPAIRGVEAAEGALAIFTDDAATKVNAGWFRGGWFDALTMEWNDVAAGRSVARKAHSEGEAGGGGSLYIPFTLKAGEEKTVRLKFAWFVPRSTVASTVPKKAPGSEPFIDDGWKVSRLLPVKDIRSIGCVRLSDDMGWQTVFPDKDRVIVHHMRGTNGVVYIARRIKVESRCERVLHVGHDGSARIFVDGRAVGCGMGAQNPIPVTRTEAPLKLSAGEHEICIALDRMDGKGWGVYVSLQKPAGECGAGCDCSGKSLSGIFYVPWYAERFSGIGDVAGYWAANYARLKEESRLFADCFYDTTLPAEVVESVAANLAILKSPTCLRQHDGRLWGWEGCGSGSGCCHGTCTHVWNYAQSIPHLFPDLERSLRETEFLVNQDDRGHQHFRAALPIRPDAHKFHAAADGQLGGLMKLYREWRISGDTAWMLRLWPAAKQSLDYCIGAWDPDHKGMLVEPHHNTYDIEFWGADGMCTSFYLGALAAAIEMGTACGAGVDLYRDLLARGRKAMGTTLWNGNWYIQKIQWKGLKAGDPVKAGNYSPEARAILAKEGPKYQYGNGCLSDGVLGDWIARCCGLDGILEERKTARHLASVFKHNFKKSLENHANPQRPGFAFPQEGGLLLCSWPAGDKPQLPFVYSDEVFTGIEYQVAAHLVMTGQVKEGLAVVHAIRERYNGKWRNPFDEYECGHWYARAMSSYGLIQAFSGATYDAVDKVLKLKPRIKGDFKTFLCTATGYGTVGIRKGKPFIKVAKGHIEVKRMVLEK